MHHRRMGKSKIRMVEFCLTSDYAGPQGSRGAHSPPPPHKPLHLIKPGLDFLGCVNRRRIQTRMAEVLLHDVQRHALLDRMRPAGMAQPMGRSRLELFGIVRPAGFDQVERHAGEAGF